MSRRQPLTIADTEVRPGRRGQTTLPAGNLISGSPIGIPVQVVHGRHDGPTVWLSAAIHGDEILGVEVIRRVLEALDPRTVHGTVLNVHGFNTGDRYLPDRRDLNRCFPGSARGSVASRLAHVLMTEVVDRCSLGIDLHTGAFGRRNLPQVRADLSDERTRHLCDVFGAPIAIDAQLRDGSLRQVATERGATVLLYEGGEALRFDTHAIAVATAGVLRVLAEVGVHEGEVEPVGQTVFSPSSSWVRSTRAGVVHITEPLGARVAKGDVVARVHAPTGRLLTRLKARHDGVVIGLQQHPLANRGDAVCQATASPSTPSRRGGLSNAPVICAAEAGRHAGTSRPMSRTKRRSSTS